MGNGIQSKASTNTTKPAGGVVARLSKFRWKHKLYVDLWSWKNVSPSLATPRTRTDDKLSPERIAIKGWTVWLARPCTIELKKERKKPPRFSRENKAEKVAGKTGQSTWEKVVPISRRSAPSADTCRCSRKIEVKIIGPRSSLLSLCLLFTGRWT